MPEDTIEEIRNRAMAAQNLAKCERERAKLMAKLERLNSQRENLLGYLNYRPARTLTPAAAD
ncbi:MAG: hypothetical protein AMXMBFR7_26580 [Planctomycetota bacterium]